MKLRVGYIKEGTRALGPGWRFVIWTQGCLRRCKDCISPEHQPLDGGYLVDTTDLADQICACRSIDGITISGGEPFLQAEALTDLLDKVNKVRQELTVLVFTGNQLEELTDSDSKALLGSIDLLIDGEYVPELNDGMGLRGSSNQRFHFLTQNLLRFKEEIEMGKRRREVYVENDNELITIGIASPVAGNIIQV